MEGGFPQAEAEFPGYFPPTSGFELGLDFTSVSRSQVQRGPLPTPVVVIWWWF